MRFTTSKPTSSSMDRFTSPCSPCTPRGTASFWCRLILHQNEAVPLGVQGEHGDVNLSIEDDVGFEVVKRIRIGADARGVLKGLQVGIQIEAGPLIERDDFVAIDGIREQRAVIHAGVKRRVTAGAEFQFGTRSEEHTSELQSL